MAVTAPHGPEQCVGMIVGDTVTSTKCTFDTASLYGHDGKDTGEAEGSDFHLILLLLIQTVLVLPLKEQGGKQSYVLWLLMAPDQTNSIPVISSTEWAPLSHSLGWYHSK